MSTDEYNPTPPWNVTATQRNGSRVEVNWQPPIHPNGQITGYQVFMSPPFPVKSVFVQSVKTSYTFDEEFEGGRSIFLIILRKIFCKAKLI